MNKKCVQILIFPVLEQTSFHCRQYFYSRGQEFRGRGQEIIPSSTRFHGRGQTFHRRGQQWF